MSFAPIPLEPVSHVRRLAAGPAGLLIAGWSHLALRRGQTWSRHAAPCTTADWVAREHDFLTVEPDGTGVAIDATGAATRVPGKAADKDVELVEAQSVWDAQRGVLVRFGGTVGGKKFASATREWKDGAWKTVKPKTKPVGRQRAAFVWAPPHGGAVMLGGWAKKEGHLDETAIYDGTDWTVFAEPRPEGKPTAPPLFWLFDPTSGQLLHGRLLEPSARAAGVWRHAGAGRWERVATLRLAWEAENDYAFVNRMLGLAWGYDPVARVLVAADGAGGFSLGTAPFAGLLDALPALAKSAPRTAATATVPAARAPERWLVAREDGVGKFWFAKLEGSSWTARWGKRGATAQSKTYALASADAAARDYDKKIAEKLAKGYVDAPDGEASARLAGAVAWEMKRSKKPGAAPADFLFGAPGFDDAHWPKCASCQRPMESLGLFHAHPERLPLGEHTALALFQCAGGCDAGDPARGASAALLLRASELGPARATPPAPLAPVPPEWVTYAAPTFEIDHAAEGSDAETSPGGSKLGGVPTWVQEPATPTCDRCATAMRLAVQLDGGDTGMNFGDVGIGYAFVCRAYHQAKLVSQSS